MQHFIYLFSTFLNANKHFGWAGCFMQEQFWLFHFFNMASGLSSIFIPFLCDNSIVCHIHTDIFACVHIILLNKFKYVAMHNLTFLIIWCLHNLSWPFIQKIHSSNIINLEVIIIIFHHEPTPLKADMLLHQHSCSIVILSGCPNCLSVN
jgi:hypothetical protein